LFSKEHFLNKKLFEIKPENEVKSLKVTEEKNLLKKYGWFEKVKAKLFKNKFLNTKPANVAKSLKIIENEEKKLLKRYRWFEKVKAKLKNFVDLILDRKAIRSVYSKHRPKIPFRLG